MLVIDANWWLVLDCHMERVRIRLMKDYDGRMAGESITVDAKLAAKLIRKGFAYRDKMLIRSEVNK